VTISKRIEASRFSGAGPSAPGRNGEHDRHGERRSNQTHRSTIDPRHKLLARKSNAVAAELTYAGHLLMQNRHALIVDIELTSHRVRRTRRGPGNAAPTRSRLRNAASSCSGKLSQQVVRKEGDHRAGQEVCVRHGVTFTALRPGLRDDRAEPGTS
jgi:hypothetical protein